MAKDAVYDVNLTFDNPEEYIQSAVAEQDEGVGGTNPPDYRMVTDVTVSPAISSGWFVGRYKSNYASEGKTDIEDSNAVGNWPAHTHQAASELFNFTNEFTINSAQNLVATTAYVSLHFWINDYYYDKIFVSQEEGYDLSDAINDTDAVGGVTVWPTGNDLIVSNEVTITATVTPATDIDGFFQVTSGATAGTTIGVATADRDNGTWSEGTPALDWVTVDSDTGELTVTTSEVAPSAGSYNINLVYDNTSAGGGSYDETVQITVQASGGGTGGDGYVAAPTSSDPGFAASFSSLSALETALAALESDWNTEMTGYGLATTGVEPIFILEAGNYGDLDWDYDFSAHEQVHIRGEGPFTRNAWKPIGGTRSTRLLWDGCKNISLWLFHFEPNSIGTTYYANRYEFKNCDDCKFLRCVFNGDVAESEQAAATEVKNGMRYMFDTRGSDDNEFINCTFMGVGRGGFFGSAGTAGAEQGKISRRNVIRGCVFDQLTNDMIQIYGDQIFTDWIIETSLGIGKARNPGNLHNDWWQSAPIQGRTPDSHGWTHRGCLILDRGHWGNNGSIATKGLHNQGSGPTITPTVTDCLFGLSGNGISGAGYGSGASVTYCTFIPPTDISGSEDREYTDGELEVTWVANTTGFLSTPISAGTVGNNVIVQNTSSPQATSMAGPGGFLIVDPGHVGTNYGLPGISQPANKPFPSGTYDFSELGNWLQNYSAPSVTSATQDRVDSALTTAVPRRDNNDLSQWEPKVGSQLHWDHANPKGAYQLMRRMFDAEDHDHWKDHGWPVAALCHLRYDLANGLAGASGNYDTFDANGD